MVVSAFEGGSRFGWTEKDILLNPMPLFHVFGFQVVALSAMVFGAKVILLEAYDPQECLKLIEREKCTATFGVPTMFQLMLDHPEFKKYNISTLKKGGMGAAPAPPALLRRLIDLGMDHVESYDGMSECSIHPQTVPTDSIEVIANTCGKSRASLDMKIVDLQTRRLCPINTPGELLIRGDTMLIEYYNQPDLTSSRIDEKGWFRTGDIWKIDEEGNYTFICRTDDVYNRGGEMISPVEVQNAITEHPKVQLAEVVGVPDPLLGQEGAAFVILHKDQKCSDVEIKEFLVNKIAKYKIPKYFIFTDQFPTTKTGKVQKFKLVEKAVEKYSL
jgi:fatty-acyl-CoA synthase